MLLRRKKKILIGVGILLDQNDKLIPYPENYQGVLYSDEFDQLPYHSKIPKMQLATEFLLEKLPKVFNNFNFSLHYSLKDLRSFQWYNYHDKEAKKIKLDLHYTCLINLAKVQDLEKFLTDIRRVRRREYNKAIKNNLTIEESDDIDILDNLHKNMFLHQGIERSKYEVDCLRKISTQAIEKNFGKLFICYTQERVACSAYLMLFDDKNAFSKYGATHNCYKNLGAYTYLTVSCILKSKELGLNYWDFLGANSPQRGDYKTSFNAKLEPFYKLRF